MSAEYWEPWTPVVGDRVRIRLNGECNHNPRELDSMDGIVCKVFEPGEPAIYVRPDGGDPQPMNLHGHRFAVQPYPGGPFHGFAYFAALELEPLG